MYKQGLRLRRLMATGKRVDHEEKIESAAAIFGQSFVLQLLERYLHTSQSMHRAKFQSGSRLNTVSSRIDARFPEKVELLSINASISN